MLITIRLQLEIGGVQQGWVWMLKIRLASSSNYVQKLLGLVLYIWGCWVCEQVNGVGSIFVCLPVL